MFLQHDDPHRHAGGIEYFYYFLILAPFLVAVVLFVAWKLLNYLEKRKAARPLEKPDRPTESAEKES